MHQVLGKLYILTKVVDEILDVLGHRAVYVHRLRVLTTDIDVAQIKVSQLNSSVVHQQALSDGLELLRK